jgi:RHS repeat-associated protein
VVNYYTYNPFGEILEVGESITNPWRFTGQYYDSEIDLYYLRARNYHPHIYRFTARDLVAGQFDNPLSLHKYLYCQNEPVNRIDPTGLWWEITHRSFGLFGFGSVTLGHPVSLFDYGRLDTDYSPFNPAYTWMHFRSRSEVYPELLGAMGNGDIRSFEYLMHEWQDAYVHYDNGFRAPLGHGLYDKTHPMSADDPRNPMNTSRHAYERCGYTTRELEKVWFKYNITNDDDPLASWFDNPCAKLPEENPWLSALPFSPLIDY